MWKFLNSPTMDLVGNLSGWFAAALCVYLYFFT
jgi:hypothetical protein